MTSAPRPDALASAIQDHRAGRFAQAEQAYRRILAATPTHPEALHFLGILAHQTGRDEEAVRLIGEAVRHRPDYAEAHNNLGKVLLALGRNDPAAAAFEHALRANPKMVEAHYNLGNARAQAGHTKAAVAAYRSALALAPNHAEARNNLGNALAALGRFEEAARELGRTVALLPKVAAVHANLGTALRRLGRLQEAAAAYRKALELDRDNARYHYALGNILKDLKQDGEAVAAYRKALELDPDFLGALEQLVHRQQQLSDWRGLVPLIQRTLDGLDRSAESVAPFTLLALPASPTQLLRCARAYATARFSQIAPLPPPPPRDRGTGTPLTVGYLSPDFRQHPVSFLTAELFERHDRDRFRVLGYSTGPDDASGIRRRIEAACDGFVDLRGLSFGEAARRIREDGVDILVDLAGHTKDAPTEIVAHRPAPIQVNYLGFPGTMGATFMDYIIVDPFVAPAERQREFSEALVLMPDCFQVNDGQRPRPVDPPGRDRCGLPPEGFVFCCFNATYKILPSMFDLWMRLLRAVEGSVLWLVAGRAEVTANLRREAEARGVDPERLVFAPRQPREDYLALYLEADLFLDTLPYNAGTTASDALWMGCPLITCPGDSFVSRMGGSLVRNVGLPELAVASLDEYEDLALRLAREPETHAELKDRLARNRDTAPLFDCARFTRNLETAFTSMWDTHAAGRPPTLIRVAPEDEEGAAR